MRKNINLSESDITRIVKKVLSESKVSNMYFRRRGVVDPLGMLGEVVERLNVCKYVKLITYFNHVSEHFILRLYLTNDIIKKELTSENYNIEKGIREYLANEKLDFLVYYYKLRCRREPKY